MSASAPTQPFRPDWLGPLVPMSVEMLKRDQKRCGFTFGQVAYGIGVSGRENRGLEAGVAWRSFDTWDAICKLYG